jgi:TIR domain
LGLASRHRSRVAPGDADDEDCLPIVPSRRPKYAQIVAEGLRSRGLAPFLESDKPSHSGEDYDRALYDALAASHAVISLLFPSSLDSAWIQFEARTAKIHRKWYPVVFGAVNMPESLMNVQRLDGAKLEDPASRAYLLDQLATAILAESGRNALVYRGRTPVAEGAARTRWQLTVSSMVSLFLAMTSLLADLGGIRESVCSDDYAKDVCEWAGWRPEGPCTDESANP